MSSGLVHKGREKEDFYTVQMLTNAGVYTRREGSSTEIRTACVVEQPIWCLLYVGRQLQTRFINCTGSHSKENEKGWLIFKTKYFKIKYNT